MTNKERKKKISKQPIPTKEECLAFYKELTNLADARFVPYYKMAIKALEQEPCEDAISRQAVLDMICNVDGMEGFENSNIFAKHYVNNVKALPSVTPQPFINKPCVSEGVCQEDKIQVLDKIRAEIKGWQVDIHDNENDADKHDFVFERIYEIFDEYKKESEDKNE